MSSSDSVRATLVMLPASLVRRWSLEVLELLDDVLVVLPGDARDLVLPEKPPRWHIGHSISSGLFWPARDLGGIGLELVGRGFCAAK